MRNGWYIPSDIPPELASALMDKSYENANSYTSKDNSIGVESEIFAKDNLVFSHKCRNDEVYQELNLIDKINSMGKDIKELSQGKQFAMGLE